MKKIKKKSNNFVQNSNLQNEYNLTRQIAVNDKPSNQNPKSTSNKESMGNGQINSSTKNMNNNTVVSTKTAICD